MVLGKPLKQIISIGLCVCVMLFLLWYLPACLFNVFSCDDYWHGMNVHDSGFWGTQHMFYMTWEGSYIHTFLATLPHVFDARIVPSIFILFSISILLLTVATLTHKMTNGVIGKIVMPLYLVGLFLLCTSGDAEIRFWVCANVSYLFGLVSCALAVYIYYKGTHKILFGILCLITLGNKVSFIPLLFLSCLFVDLLKKRFSTKSVIVLSLLIALLSMPNILAPGNLVRLEENMECVAETGGMTIMEILCFQLFKVYLSGLASSLLIFPVFVLLKPEIEIGNRYATLYAFVLSILFVISNAFIMYVSFRDPGPLRSNVLVEYCCFFVTTIGLIQYRKRLLKRGGLICKIVAGIIIIYVSYLNIGNITQLKATEEYSLEHKQRDRIVLSAEAEVIEVPPIKEQGLLHKVFCNDIEWLNNVYLPYFKKKGEIQIKTQ